MNRLGNALWLCPLKWTSLTIAVAVWAISSIACDNVERTQFRGLMPAGATSASENTAPTGQKADAAQKKSNYSAYTDEDFVESDNNRDPFRTFTTLFKTETPHAPQRQVAMSNTAIEEMRLIAIVTGTDTPKAMLVDPSGVGHVVERGMYIGKPQIVRASENVLLTLNWRVDRIRANEVVLTREDPTDPNRPPLTRVISMREEQAHTP